MSSRRVLVHIAALLGYAGCAAAFSWPALAKLGTHLPGPPSGDTGVYVWNSWVFRQEILEKGWPFATTRILGLADSASLALENYTVFQNLLALPLIPAFGVIASFNLVLLGMMVLTAYGMFLLARREVGHDGAAWLAGMTFAWSPVLVARSTAHASLVAAGALPFFVIAFGRLQQRRSVGSGVLTGLVVAWATYSDVYYGVYCVLLGVVLLLAPRLTWERRDAGPRLLRRALDVLMVLAALVYVAIAVTGGTSLRVGSYVLHARTLYTPALLLTLIATVRVATVVRLRLEGLAELCRPALLRSGAVAIGTTVTLLAPLVLAVLRQLAAGDPTGTATQWRSSPPGVDLLAFVLPNPNNPRFGFPIHDWLARQSGAFVENAASLPWMMLAAIVAAAVLSGRRSVPRGWLGVTVVFSAFALGPFIQFGGFNTALPGPWALLRFVPVVGLARTPSRFVIVVTLAACVLLAHALADLLRRRRGWARVVVPVVGALLALELNPAPRELHAATLSSVYEIIAADPRDVRVLELPFGLRDGTQSFGNFRTTAQFAQITHGKRLLGAYLSRLPRRAVHRYQRRPTTAALIRLSQGGSLSPQERGHLIRRGYSFVHRTRLAYVVMTPGLVSPELEQFAIEAFALQRVAADDHRVLYRTSFDESALVVYGEAALRDHHPPH